MSHSLAEHYREILVGVGENPQREGLLDTPQRAAKAMQYLCNGYTQSLGEIVNGALFESQNDEMVVVRDIELYSLCEHHMLPFIGKAHVAYLPTGRVLGLSKVARLVDMFARRKHMCMMMRGVEKQNSVMISSVMLGEFRDSPTTRHEFLTLIGRHT
ncbi:GTP cyclohydrolase I [Pseudomonas sp.]|uniref:GTP cyclohydrolase I n=1 Tax=Pseudomonas sp. TaxID=306 RepID=UPI001DFFF19A|nr:GTP cyclohydrolase I [Pseudomonas sp.]MBS6038829.1 GTP cyclohydrolase I [Pseudomonas sp.]